MIKPDIQNQDSSCTAPVACRQLSATQTADIELAVKPLVSIGYRYLMDNIHGYFCKSYLKKAVQI